MITHLRRSRLIAHLLAGSLLLGTGGCGIRGLLLESAWGLINQGLPTLTSALLAGGLPGLEGTENAPAGE